MKPHWKFFPVRGKQPALEGDWRKHSTSDPIQLQAWRDASYGLALDCGASGVLVIDLDPGSTRSANLPKTMTKTTPRGGTHEIFEGAGPTTVAKLAPHVDTRGEGGYIVWEGPGYGPPVGDLAPLPQWISDRLAVQKDGHAAQDIDLDQPQNLERATAYLKGRAEITEGAGADAETLQVANYLLDMGVSPDRAIDLMVEHLKITPRDDRLEAFVTRKVENAEAYRQNAVGAKAVGPPLSMFGDTLARLGLNAERRADTKAPRFYAYSVEEQDDMRPPVMVVPDFLPAEAVTMLYGPKGSFKSFLALDFALTLAAGVKGWGWEGEETPVVYVAGEGPRSVARMRRPAWEREKGVDWDYPFHLVTAMPTMTTVSDFIEQLKDRQRLKPKVIVIDTMARFMAGLNENDVKDAQAAVSALEHIRDVFGCAVLVVHHTGKAGDGPRGSSALPGAIDTIHEVSAHRATRCVEVKNLYQKDGEELTTPWCFEGHKAHGSLIFRPITPGQYRSMTTQDDGLSPKRVQEVLVKLRALGPPGVTTRAISTELYQGAADEDPATTQEKLRVIDAKLVAASRGRLAPLTERLGRELRWFVGT